MHTEFNLRGSYLTGNEFNAYDVWLTPCASYFELFDGSVLGADENCVWNQQEVQAYLGDGFYMKIYHN